MTLRKWCFSSTKLLETIPDDFKEMGDLQIATGKALGVHWNTKTDSLHVATIVVDADRVPIKCYIVYIVAKSI